LFVGNMILIGALEDVASPTAAVLAPFGSAVLSEMLGYWTAAEKNARLMRLPAMLLWNRVLWLTVAAAVLAALHHRFRFAHAGEAGRRSRRERRRVIATAEHERL